MLLRSILAGGFVVATSLAAAAQQSQEQPDPGEGQTPPPMAAEVDDGQQMAEAAAVEAAISTQLTWQSHSINPFTSANFLEGAACPGATRMVSGACHPGYSDRVIIVNQYPNVGGNTWRCGFRNNNATQRTVWIYTLCAQ